MAADKILEWVEYTKVNKEITTSKERVVNEIGLSIFINKKHFTTAMITPIMPKEFVIGHLFGQGIIRRVTDIESITIKANIAEVTLRDIKAREEQLPAINSDFKVSSEDIFNGVKAILKSGIFAETEAVHSTGLFTKGAKPICITDDIGRHNALDKVIGYGLLNDIDFGNTFASSTGRQPSEMILRCGNANIPIIATKGVPTTLAIEIAQKVGITIVGLVRGSSLIVYSNPARIE